MNESESESVMPPLLGADLYLFSPGKKPDQLHPLVLAYIGDAVYEVFVRQYVVSLPNHRPNHLHRLATQYVSAKAQCRMLDRWMPVLTEDELAIVKRGRNAKSGTTAKNASVLEYRHSTAFECLVGYLYYTKQLDRLRQLLDLVFSSETSDSAQRKGNTADEQGT